MRQAQVDISTLSARALGRWSAIGYSVKSGRLEVFVPATPVGIEVKKLPDLVPGDGKPNLPNINKPGGGRRNRSIGSAASGVIEFYFPGDEKPHFRCPPGTRRAGKWTNQMGSDCNLGGARAALSRIGQRIERMAQGEPGRGDLPTVGRRLEVAKERAASKLDYDDPENRLEAIAAKKRAKKIAKELEKAKKEKLGESKKGKRVGPKSENRHAEYFRKMSDEDLEKMIQSRKNRDYSKPQQIGMDPSIEEALWAEYRARQLRKGIKTPKSDDKLEALASKLDYDDPNNKLKPKKPRKKRDMAATLEGAASKLDYDDPDNKLKPKKKRKGKGKRTDVAATLDQAAGALDYNDPNNALKPKKPKDEGKLPAPKRTLLQRLKDRKNRKKSPKATAMEAVTDDAAARPGKAPTPEIAPDAKPTAAKKPKAGKAGKQFGNAFSNEKNVKSKAMTLALDEGQTMYVVQDDKGKFRIMDEERFLATEGATPFAIFGPDGQPIELPDMGDDDPDEIVDDVNKVIDAIPNDIIAEEKALDVPKGDTTLELSKTGAFLPPDLTPEALRELGATKDDDFIAAFEAQREEIRDYWNGRVDLDKFTSFDEALAAIDAHIAKRDKDGATQKELGQLRAERKNFLAAWMPDEDGEVDPYARANFLQPKRRTALIEQAGIGDLVVGKKTANKKVDVPDEKTPDLPAFGGDGSASTGDPKWVARLEDVKTEYADKIANLEEQLDQYFEDAGDALPVDYLEKMRQDNFQLMVPYAIKTTLTKQDKEDMALIIARDNAIQRRIDVLNGNTEQADTTPENAPNVPSVPEKSVTKPTSMSPGQFHLALLNDTQLQLEVKSKTQQLLEPDEDGNKTIDQFWDPDSKQYDLEQLYAVASQVDEQYGKLVDILSTQDELTPEDRQAYIDARAEMLHFEDLRKEALAANQKANLEAAQKTVDIAEPATPNAGKTFDEVYEGAVAAMKTDAVNASVEEHYKSLSDAWAMYDNEPAKKKEAMLRAAEQYLGNADLQRAKMLSDWENWQDEPDIYALETEQTLRKLAAKLLDEANKIETEDQPESTSNAHSLTAVFAGAGPSFDPKQLLDKELGKFDGNINVAGARAGKGDADYKKIQSIISQSGFAALSPDEQRTKLREALGAADDFELAKKVGKAIATQSSGSVEQLEALRIVASNFDVGVDKDYAKFVAATNAVAVAQGRLDAAQARLAAITDADSPLIRLAAEVEVTNARLETATALMQQLRHVDLEAPDWAGLSDEEAEAALDRIGRVYEALARNVDESSTLRQLLDSVGAGKATGASLPSHAPQKSADGLPDVADDFDASLLGSIGKADGKAIAVSVPIGNRGIFSRKQAVQYVAQGGKLSDVPDVHLKESIWENVGPGKRFQVIQDGSIISGYNDKGAATRDKTTGFIDTVTGKQYVLKSPHRNDQEYVQELAGARVQQLLGIPAPGMRIAGPVQLKADKDGKMSPQAPILMEHVGNLFGFDALQDVSGDLNPESFAHLVVMDRVFNYYDRTPANFVPVTMPDGTVHYQPIDHGNAFYGFLGGPTAEEAVGLIRTSKSDNIVPGQIAQSEFVTPEQKRAYGVAMMEAIRKYKRTNWRAAMKEIGDRQNLPEEARKKLEQHGEYLEARKDSLDWDTMTQTALLDLGLTAAEIQDITGEVDAKYMKYAPPADAPTPVDAAVIAQSQPAMNFGSFFAYDGGDIEDFAVQVQRTQIKGLTGPDGQPHNGDGTTLTFKLHGAAKAYEPSEADGWTVLTKGHPVPLQSAQTGATPEREAEWDFERLLVSADGTPTYAVGSNDELVPSAAGATSIMFVRTWAKTMPDGTVVMVTRPITSAGTTETKKHSLVGTVRIVAPGKPEEVLSDSAKIQEYMTAAGVTSHTAPGSMEFEQSAVRKLGRLLFGSKSDDMTYDEIVAGIAERGYSLDDDLVVRKLSNGKVQLGFSAEKTAALVEELDIQWFVHNFSDSSDEQIVETLVTGALGSTTTRFNNGIQRVGMSSATDVRRKGSGDYAFLYPITSSHIDNTSYHASQTRAYAVYLPPETIISRTDWYGTETDVYGEIEGRTDSLDPEKYKHVEGQTSPEVMVKGQIPLTHAVVSVPKYQRDSIIAKVKARGVTEIGGVPIEEIVVASEDAQAARIAAGERARAALS